MAVVKIELEQIDERERARREKVNSEFRAFLKRQRDQAKADREAANGRR